MSWTSQQLVRRTKELMVSEPIAFRYIGIYMDGECPSCGHKPVNTYESTVLKHARTCSMMGWTKETQQ